MAKKVISPFGDSKNNSIGYTFWCPGCEEYHGVWTKQKNPKTNAQWSFNGNEEKPTFSPSLLIRSGHYDKNNKGDCWCDYNKKNPKEKAPFKCTVCHSFIIDGMIRYLNDCTHKLAGKTVQLTDCK